MAIRQYLDELGTTPEEFIARGLLLPPPVYTWGISPILPLLKHFAYIDALKRAQAKLDEMRIVPDDPITATMRVREQLAKLQKP